MITETSAKVRVSQLRFQCGTEKFSEVEKVRQLVRAEEDCILPHIVFWVIFLAAVFAYAAFGAAYGGGR